MIQPAALHALTGQQIDQVLAEAQLHQGDRLVHVVERAAEHVDVKRPDAAWSRTWSTR